MPNFHINVGRNVFERQFHQAIDHGFQIVGLFVDTQLVVGGGAAIEDRVNVLDLFPRAEIVEHVVDKLQQLANQIFGGNFLLFAKIDHHAVQTVTHGAPLVLLNQHAPVETKAKVLLDQAGEFGDDGLEQSGDGDSVVDARGNVADAKLQRREKRMRPAIPPDLLP